MNNNRRNGQLSYSCGEVGPNAQGIWITLRCDRLLSGILGGVVEESFEPDAKAVGKGNVHVQAPSGAALDIPVAVVHDSAVAEVSLNTMGNLNAGSSYSVNASALDTSGNRILDPDCTWFLTPADGSVQFTSQGQSSAFVTSDSPASATVTCSVGSAEGTIVVSFD